MQPVGRRRSTTVEESRRGFRPGSSVRRLLLLLLLLLPLLQSGCARGSAPGPWQQENGYRWRELAPAPRGTNGFTSLSGGQTGVSFRNTVRDSLVLANRILVQGGGVPGAPSIMGGGVPGSPSLQGGGVPGQPIPRG